MTDSDPKASLVERRSEFQKSNLVLNAIAALIVREHEIVAVVGSKPPLFASDSNIDGSDSPPNPGEPLNVVASEEDSNTRFTDVPFEDIKNSDGRTNFVALANRRDDDHLTSTNSNTSSCILVKGASHWPQISTNQCHGLSLRKKPLLLDPPTNHAATISDYTSTFLKEQDQGEDRGISKGQMKEDQGGDDTQGRKESGDADTEAEIQGMAGAALAYKRWFRPPITQFVVIKVISSYCDRIRSPSSQVMISHLTTQKFNEQPEPRHAIHKLFPNEPALLTMTFDAKGTITPLQKRANSFEHSSEYPAVLRAFAPQEDGLSGTFRGREDCDGFLSAVIQNLDGAIDAKDIVLRKLISLLDPSEIGVSKLCCLVRSVYWRSVGDSEEQFIHRGNHQIMSPMELPSCTSSETLDKVLGVFRGFVRCALSIMMEEETPSIKPTSRHKYHRSSQTDTFSTGTGKSGPYVFDVLFPSPVSPTSSQNA